MKKSEDLNSGWIYSYGGTFHFEHINLEEADIKVKRADELYVVETINGTFAGGKKSNEVHFNKYFSFNLEGAIALAARMIIDFEDVAENIVAIRPATEEEAKAWLKADEYFEDKLPGAIQD